MNMPAFRVVPDAPTPPGTGEEQSLTPVHGKLYAAGV